jgi:hypothetical protein
VTLRYVVDLSFTREPWPFGNERAGQFTGDAVYLIAQPVFIAPVADGPMRVRPVGWLTWQCTCQSGSTMVVDQEPGG